jgi:hypothetical protein
MTQTSAGIRALGQESSDLASLRSRYGIKAHYLHGDCFYNGHRDPEDFIVELICETSQYIEEAENLA